jgi:hypothetical protein
MFFAKIKMVTAIGLTVAVLGTGGSLIAYRPQGAARALARSQDPPAAQPERSAAPRSESGKRGKEQVEKADHKELPDARTQLVEARRVEMAFRDREKLLMDQVFTLVAQLQKMQGLRGYGDRSAELEKARDEIEQLEAQLEVKKAHIQVARANLQAAQARLQGLQGAAQSGVVGKPELDQVRFGVVAAEAQLRVKEAELKEPAVRLKQARRRFANLDQAGKPPQESGPGPRERRLRELEKQLETLRKEMEALRREKGPDEARPSPQ